MKEQIVKWCMAVGVRAVKTFCQSILSLVTVGQSMLDLNWIDIFWVSLTAAFLSVITSIVTGVPEADSASVDRSAKSNVDGTLLVDVTGDGAKMSVDFNRDISQLKHGDKFVLEVRDSEGDNVS